MRALNCWEFMKCGREAGGTHVHDKGVCPAASFRGADGFLGGRNGGRACAYITGTFCAGTIQGTHAEKMKLCGACDFYHELREQHGNACSAADFATFVRRRPR
jgi:hypothetical protein